MIDNKEVIAKLEAKIKELEEHKQSLGAYAGNAFDAKPIDKIDAVPTETVCKCFLPLGKGSYNVIAGQGGVGKSTISLKSAMIYLRDNVNDKALLIMGEDSAEEIKKRINIIAHNDLMLDEYTFASVKDRMLFITVDNDKPLRFVEYNHGKPEVNALILASFKKFIIDNNVKFVVLDPLKKFHSVKENENSDMDILVRDVFLHIAGTLKIVLLVLHHTSKEGKARGATTITDTARIAYKLQKKMKRDKSTGEIVEDEAFKGKVRVSVIKDNSNIFEQYGYRNTNRGIIELYKKATHTEVEYNDSVYIPKI